MSRALFEELEPQLREQARRIALNGRANKEAVDDIVQKVMTVILERLKTDPGHLTTESEFVGFTSTTTLYKCFEQSREPRFASLSEPFFAERLETRREDRAWLKIRERFPDCESIARELQSGSARRAIIVRLRCEGKEWRQIAAEVNQSVRTAERHFNEGVRELQRLAAAGKYGESP